MVQLAVVLAPEKRQILTSLEAGDWAFLRQLDADRARMGPMREQIRSLVNGLHLSICPTA